MGRISVHPVDIPVGRESVQGDLRMPPDPTGLVIFAHGSGSSRFSGRNRRVAEFLGERGFATLLLDLLTTQEEAVDDRTAEYRFDIARLGPRVSAAADWAATRSLGAPLRLAPTTRRPFSSAWCASPPPIRPRPITPNSSIPVGAPAGTSVRNQGQGDFRSSMQR